MTLPRSPLVDTVLDSIRQVPAILTDGKLSIWAGLLAALSWMVGAPNLRLLSITLALMLLDLVVGASVAALRSLRADLDPSVHLAPGEGWDLRKLYGGIVGKVVRILAIPVASCADWLLLTAPFGGRPDPTAYAYPISAYVLWALAVAELVSAAKTLAAAGVAPAALGGLVARLQASQPKLELPTSAKAEAKEREP